LVKQSSLLQNLNKKVLLTFINRWLDYTDERQNSKRRHAQDDQDREVKMIVALTETNLVNNLNQKVITLLLDAWKSQALAQAQPNKEDINILFNNLEISPLVENPIVRVEVKVIISIIQKVNTFISLEIK